MLLQGYDACSQKLQGIRKILMDICRTKLFSPQRIEKLAKNAGADRISENAILKLEGELFLYGEMIAKEAICLAIEDKRKTVMTEDITLATSNVNSRLRQ
jgi:histone H3/H4